MAGNGDYGNETVKRCCSDGEDVGEPPNERPVSTLNKMWNEPVYLTPHISGIAETVIDARAQFTGSSESRLSRELRRIAVDFETHPAVRFIAGLYGRRTTAEDAAFATFFRTMTLLMRSGLTLAEALDTALTNMPDSALTRDVAELLRRVDNGETLTKVIRDCRSFPWYVRPVLNVGEISGTLDRQFERLSLHFERSSAVQRTIKSILIYPLFVLATATVVGIFMATYIIPQFRTFYVDFFGGGEAQLPLLTRNLFRLSQYVIDHYLFLLYVPVVPPVVRLARNFRLHKPMYDWLTLRIPIFGGIARRVNIVRIFRTIYTLKECGITLDDAMLAAIDQIDNVHYRRALGRMRNRLMNGDMFSATIVRERVFPPLIRKMLKRLEAGRDCDTFKLIADYYERELDMTTRNLAVLVEPAIMLVIGAMVGITIIALYLPMFNLVDVIK